MKSPIRLALAIAAISMIAPAMAQEVIGTLTVNSGTVMTSTGGEFVSAATGEAIEVGEQIMVSEGAKASVTFVNGMVSPLKIGVQSFTGVPTPLVGAPATSVGTAGGASAVATAGVIAGTAAAVAAASEAANDDDSAPDSPVSR